MSAEIDRLDIAIESQARSALNDVNNLYEGLRNVSRVLSGMKFSNFERVAAQLQALSRINLTNLNKKLDFNIKLDGSDVQKTEEAVRVSSGKISSYLSKAAKNMADEYHIASQSVRKEIDAMFQAMADGSTAKPGGDTIRSVLNASSFSRGEFSKLIGMDLGTATDEWREFLDYIEQNKILYTQDVQSMAQYTQVLAGQVGNIGNILSSKGKIDLDTAWEGLMERFPNIMGSAADAVEDKFEHILTVIRRAREETERFNPMDSANLGSEAANDWINDFSQKLLEAQNGVRGIINEVKESLPGNKIMLDVGINEEKFQSDIDRAITNASNKRYDLPIKLNIDIDKSALRNTLQAEIANIDGSKIQTIATAYKDMATAMASFNTASNAGGTEKTIKALSRVASIDMSNFNGGAFSSMASSIATIAQLPDVSQTVNRLVNSIARLANSGTSIQTVSTNLPMLGQSLQSLFIALAGQTVEGPVNSLISSIARLATAGNKTTQAATSIPVLTASIIDFFRAMQNAPKVSSQTEKMTVALATLAENSKNIKKAGDDAASSFKNLGSSSDSAASKVASGAKSIISHLTGIGKSASGIKKVTLSLKNLLAVAVGFYGIRSLFNWGKEAINLASDLTEVQNVVENSFGTKGTEAVEKFTETSIEKLGMSELTAKKTASRFQAMGNAMGITADQVANATSKVADRMNKDLYDTTADTMGAMSLNLTSLAADMASFYNVEQDAVSTALNSIYTGNTRPLRQFGLDLTQATLSEWAMKNGLDADIQSMSQAQKTLLRYQYVMANTSTIQGDFARTSMTWANQVRILKQNFEVLGKTIGNILVNTFRPLIIWLNKAMSHVIAFAETIGNALGKIFGWKILHTPASTAADSLGELADSLDDAGAGGSDAADGINDTTDAVKKLERTILGFDEINKLNEISTPSTSKSGSGSGGSGDSGAGAGTVDASGADFMVQQSRSWLEEYKSNIQSLYGLGKEISGKLADALESIEWDVVFRKARNFGTDLASFLNGLISPRLFYDLGMTVANAINTALTAQLSFASHFNWTNFGQSLAALVNGLIDNFSVELLADTLNAWAKGIFNAAAEALGGVNWTKMGIRLRVFLMRVDWKGILEAVGRAIGAAFNAAIDLAKGLFSGEGLEDNPATRALEKLRSTVTKVASLVDWDKLVKSISNLVEALAPAVAGFAEGLIEVFGKFGELGAELLNVIADVFQGIADALNAMPPDMVEDIGKALGIVAAAIISINTADKVVGILGGIVGKLTGRGISKEIEAVGTAIGEVGASSTSSSGPVSTFFKSLFSNPAVMFATLIAGTVEVGAAIDRIQDKARGGNGVWSELANLIDQMATEFSPDLRDELFLLIDGFENTGVTGDEAAQKLAEFFQSHNIDPSKIEGALHNAQGALNMTGGEVDTVEKALSILKETVGDTGTTVGLTTEEFSGFKSVVKDLCGEGFIKNPDMIDEVNKVLANCNSEGKTANETYAALAAVFGDDAEAVAYLAQQTKEKVPSAFSTIETGADKAIKKVNGLGAPFADASEKIEGTTEKTGGLNDGLLGFAASIGLKSLILSGLGGTYKGIGDKAEGADTQIGDFGDTVSGLATTVSNTATDMEDSGEAIVDGLTTGLTGTYSIDEIDKAAQKMSNAITGGTAMYMKIASPSKVMEEMGKNVVLGLANGISNNLINITTQVNNMMLKVTTPIQTMINGMQAKGADAVNKFKTGMASVSFSDALTKMTSSMNFKNLNTNLYNAGKTAGEYLASGLKSVSMPRLSYYISSWDAHSLTNGGTSYTPTYSPSWYALGGFPNMGELFIANEHGPEMLGKMGHRNVVANNQQITAGIKAAVVDGMMEVAMSGVLGGANDSAPYVMNVTVKTENDEALARAVQRGQMRRNSRFSPAATMI